MSDTLSPSLAFDVYNPDGERVAAIAHIEDGAAILALYGHGATIRAGAHIILYTNGVDGEAGESFDAVATHVDGTLLGLQMKQDREKRGAV